MTARNISSASMSGLRLWQLKNCAFLLGLGSTGTRAALEEVIQRRLEQPCPPRKKTRVVSVDMGIRNLAICVLESPKPRTEHQVRQESGSTELHVTAWKKVDLLGALARNSDVSNAAAEIDDSDTAKQMLKAAFTPSVMCKTAYDTTRLLLESQPDTILIERQRFRSGGAAAIQEWTVRVNMLESMLWACLRTLREVSGSKAFPTIHEVSPAKVASFWLAGPGIALRPTREIFDADGKSVKDEVTVATSARRKTEKKDKIAVVKSWLGESGDGAGGGEVQLRFEDEAVHVAQNFLVKQNRGRRGTQGKEGVGKLDDLADCLLQGAAWVRWEENRRRMRAILEMDQGDMRNGQGLR